MHVRLSMVWLIEGLYWGEKKNIGWLMLGGGRWYMEVAMKMKEMNLRGVCIASYPWRRDKVKGFYMLTVSCIEWKKLEIMEFSFFFFIKKYI